MAKTVSHFSQCPYRIYCVTNAWQIVQLKTVTINVGYPTEIKTPLLRVNHYKT